MTKLTEQKLRKRVRGMLNDATRNNYDIDGSCRFNRMLDKAILSGALDIEVSEDNYYLPKVVLVALLLDLADQYTKGFDKDFKAEVENLRRLI